MRCRALSRSLLTVNLTQLASPGKKDPPVKDSPAPTVAMSVRRLDWWLAFENTVIAAGIIPGHVALSCVWVLAQPKAKTEPVSGIPPESFLQVFTWSPALTSLRERLLPGTTCKPLTSSDVSVLSEQHCSSKAENGRPWQLFPYPLTLAKLYFCFHRHKRLGITPLLGWN